MKASFSGYLSALLATIIWSGNFVVARAFAPDLPPCQFNFWRWLIAFIAILPFAIPALGKEWGVLKANFAYLSLMGLLGVTLMNTFIYKAGQSAESLNMALLMPATPIVILILARIFYHELISGKRLIGMLIAMAGIIILICKGSWQKLAALDFTSGDIWTLGCMLCFAFYSLLMRKRPENITPVVFNAAVFGLGLAYALPLVGVELYCLPAPSFSWPLFGGLLYAGIGCSTLAFWLWTLGIDRIGPVKAGIVYYSLPLFAAIMSTTILGEKVVAVQVIGGLLIISGIFIASLPSHSSRLASH